MNVLLETTTISAILRQEQNTVARLNALSPPNDVLAISLVSYGEIWYGLEVMPQGQRRREREQRARDLFARVILEPVTQDVAHAYVKIKSDLHRKGEMIPEADLWIAATAKANGYVLVTRDDHFSRVEGLIVEDWSKL